MIYHILYIPVIYRLNMDEQKTTTKNDDHLKVARAIFAADAIVEGKMTKAEMQRKARMILKYLEATDAYSNDENWEWLQ